MYYRRKILLALLEQSDNSLEKIRLHKLLLIISEKQQNKTYNFVPNKFGCYSFQANADLNTLKTYGLVNESDIYWYKTDKTNYYNQLNPDDKLLIKKVINEFGALSTKELVKYTYINYPYYATKSIIASKLLTGNELKIINREISNQKTGNSKTLYTIGYEGLNIEQYLNKLIRNNIKVLCDVRRNPVSMKYGFSKNQLMRACNSLHIKYYHFPSLGIASEKRQSLETQNDYDLLFEVYKSTVLKNEILPQQLILKLIGFNNNAAVTCFESDINKCHRTHLANALTKTEGWKLNLIHL
ncbi:MAG: DUF488 family protein [Ignavibacteriaceae bacterium]